MSTTTGADTEMKQVEDAEASGIVSEKSDDDINDLNRPYQTGDVCLIASDSVKFRVNSWRLMTMSEVFRDTLGSHKNGEDAQIELTDKSMESGKWVRMMLDTFNGETDLPLHDNGVFQLAPAIALIRLLTKYSCTIPLEMLKGKLVYSLFADGDSNYEVFVFGSVMDDVNLCHRAISMYQHQTWETSEQQTGGLGDFKWGACTMDLRSWPTSDFERLPTKYFRALLRAQCGKELSASTKWAEIADEFKDLMAKPEEGDRE